MDNRETTRLALCFDLLIFHLLSFLVTLASSGRFPLAWAAASLSLLPGWAQPRLLHKASYSNAERNMEPLNMKHIFPSRMIRIPKGKWRECVGLCSDPPASCVGWRNKSRQTKLLKLENANDSTISDQRERNFFFFFCANVRSIQLQAHSCTLGSTAAAASHWWMREENNHTPSFLEPFQGCAENQLEWKCCSYCSGNRFEWKTEKV